MLAANEVIEELHQIRHRLLDEANGDLSIAMQHAHDFAKSFCLPVVQGQPRRPVGWKESQQGSAHLPLSR